MKTLKNTFRILFLTLAVGFTSCSSDDDNGGGSGGGGGGEEFLIAKVDGADFEAAQDPAVIVSATTSNGVLTFHGGNNSGNTIRGTIQSYTGVGTYTTGDNLTNVNSLTYLTLPANAWMSTFDIGSGTVTITSDDGTTVEGTFSFEGYNASDQTTKSITNGSFKAIID